MIYAIRAVGTEFVKVGFAASVGKRLKELETGCPHDLHIEAVADWPREQERAIHYYLVDSQQRLEWFRDSERTATVINWLRDGESGERAFRVEFLRFAKEELGRVPMSLVKAYEYPSQNKQRELRATLGEPRISAPPKLNTTIDGKANERFEHIKQQTIARKARRQACTT